MKKVIISTIFLFSPLFVHADENLVEGNALWFVCFTALIISFLFFLIWYQFGKKIKKLMDKSGTSGIENLNPEDQKKIKLIQDQRFVMLMMGIIFVGAFAVLLIINIIL